MRARSVVVAEVTEQNPSHVPFAEDDYVVEAFTPNRSDDALDIRILPRRTRCDENRLDPESVDAAREVVAVGVGTVKKSMETRSLR